MNTTTPLYPPLAATASATFRHAGPRGLTFRRMMYADAPELQCGRNPAAEPEGGPARRPACAPDFPHHANGV